ncbi:hypothetical protein C0Q58_13595 [Streptomyces albidoflavus]|nr:hypothetical protein C0Q58_13595 [Streptomyces albidoflavus]
MGAGGAGGRAGQGTGCVNGMEPTSESGLVGSGLPDGWAYATLDDLADVAGGVTKDSKKQFDEAYPEVPYLRVANVQREHLDLAQVATIRVSPENAARYRLCRGDVLMTEGGDRDKLGRGWVWEDQIPGCIHQNHVFRARIWDEAMIPVLLAWYVNSVARRWLEANAKQSVNLASISISTIKQMPVPVPPFAEQRRIFEVLKGRLARLDAIEANLRAALDALDRLDSAVLDSVATGALERVSTAPPIDHIVEAVAEVSGGIQKQARRRPQDNPHPFLRVANVGRGVLDLADIHEIELFDGEIDRYRLKEGDLLVVEGNGSADQIGRAALWHDEIKDCVHQNHLIRVRPGPQLRAAYLELVWNSPTVARRLQRVANSTSGLFTLSTRKLKSLVIPVAPLEEQDRLVKAARAHQSRISKARSTTRTALAHTAALRRGILADAFAGRLVPQDPVEESAGELLKRIRVKREAIEAERKASRRAARARAKAEARLTTPPPPPTRTTSAVDAIGEQGTLPMEFSA